MKAGTRTSRPHSVRDNSRTRLENEIEAGLRSPLRNPASSNDRPKTIELKPVSELQIQSRGNRGRIALSPSQPGLNPRSSEKRRPNSSSLKNQTRPCAKVCAAAAASIVKVITDATDLFIPNLRVGNGNECATSEGASRDFDHRQSFSAWSANIVPQGNSERHSAHETVYDMVIRRTEMEWRCNQGV